MRRDPDLEQKLASLIESADWPDLVPRLLALTRSTLVEYGGEHRRRWQTVTHSYVVRAAERVLDRGVPSRRIRDSDTLFRLLAEVIRELVDEDERVLREILARTDWDDVLRRVLAYTVHLGPSSVAGKSPGDYVSEAVLQLLTRQRHFPHDQGVTLVAFLCRTVQSMRSHDLAKAASQGQHLSIVPEGRGPAGPGEFDSRGLFWAPSSANDLARDFLASLEPDLRKYAKLRAEERHGTAKEYAKALGVTEQTVRNFDRRLKRRRDRWDRRSR